MIWINYTRGRPEWLWQIGRRGARAWLTVGTDGFVLALAARRLLCLKSPKARAYFSERNRVGVKMLAQRGGWRLFVKERTR